MLANGGTKEARYLLSLKYRPGSSIKSLTRRVKSKGI